MTNSPNGWTSYATLCYRSIRWSFLSQALPQRFRFMFQLFPSLIRDAASILLILFKGMILSESRVAPGSRSYQNTKIPCLTSALPGPCAI